jgi:hypothetical protein
MSMNRTSIYSKREIALFNFWRERQNKHNYYMKLFNNIYKPWNDNTIMYNKRYNVFMKNYRRYQITKDIISDEIRRMLYFSNEDNDIKNMIFDTLKNEGFYPNDIYKTSDMINCVSPNNSESQTNNMINDTDTNSMNDNTTNEGNITETDNDSNNDSNNDSDNDSHSIHFDYKSNSEYNSDYDTPYHSGYESEEDMEQ